MLLILTLLGCRNLSCGDYDFAGEIPVTYIDGDHGEQPIGGKFKNRCTHPVTGSGLNSTVYFDPSLSWTGVSELHMVMGVDHRNQSIDWNVARNWWVEADVLVERIVLGETVSAGDGITGLANYWYSAGASAGDAVVGPSDNLGFVSHYMPGPTEGEIRFTRSRGDSCDDLEIRATWDLSFGTPEVTDSWSTATGDNWFGIDPELGCSGLLILE